MQFAYFALMKICKQTTQYDIRIMVLSWLLLEKTFPCYEVNAELKMVTQLYHIWGIYLNVHLSLRFLFFV